MIKSDKLIEATILALQGKLVLNENKSKKSEARHLIASQKKLIKQYAKDQANGKDPQWYKLISDLEDINDYETLNQDARRFLDDLDLDECKDKKQESIDVNIDEDTTVSVEGNETIVDTDNATVIVNKKEDEFVPETSDDVETTNDTVEIPTDDTVMPEEVIDEPVDTELPIDSNLGESRTVNNDDVKTINVKGLSEAWKIVKYKNKYYQLSNDEYTKFIDNPEKFLDTYMIDGYRTLNSLISRAKNDAVLGPLSFKESKKSESVEIEVSDDGKEVEVTTDNSEEVEVKDETPDNNEEENEDTETEVPTDEPSIDEMVEENKKVTEDINESNVRKAAIELNQKDRDRGEETATMTGMIATRIADIAEELGDDYSEWLDTDDVREMADEIVTSKMWTEFNNQLDDFIRETIEDKVDWIRKDEPASKYYEGNPELDESKKIDVEEGKQADLNTEQNHRQACFIKENKESINPTYAKIKEDKANKKINRKKQEAFSKFKSTIKSLKVEAKNAKLQETKYSNSTWYTYKVNDTEYNFICRTYETSRNWGHDVELKKGFNTIATAKVTYYNRTWESFEYQTCMLKAIENAIKSGADEASMNNLKEQVKKGTGLRESKITTDEVKSKKAENKFSSKSFNKALTEYYSKKFTAVESVEVNKVTKTLEGLKIEATLINKNTKNNRDICLEMKKIQSGKSFDKYTLVNTQGIKLESKSKNTQTIMTTTNAHNILECRYIINK